jgi:hypothetical protein
MVVDCAWAVMPAWSETTQGEDASTGIAASTIPATTATAMGVRRSDFARTPVVIALIVAVTDSRQLVHESVIGPVAGVPPPPAYAVTPLKAGILKYLASHVVDADVPMNASFVRVTVSGS